MTQVTLDDEEWTRVMAIIATASWTAANPLLMKIGDQLRQQTQMPSAASQRVLDGMAKVDKLSGN